MKVVPQKRSLESLRIFPYVAWGLVFTFAWFVYTLAIDLHDTARELKVAADLKEERAKTPIENIIDFEI